MKLLIEPSSKDNLYLDIVDGVILPLDDYSVESIISFSIDEIEEISQLEKEVFVKINKNLVNEDIDNIIDVLKKIDSMNVKGVFFYDLAILQLKKELNLSVDLVWNQTHMVNNYKTCNYYAKKVKYALLGKEITLEEIIEIINKSKIISMVEVVSKPSIAFSRRKLITNYAKDIGKDISDEIIIHEKVSNYDLLLRENNNGTSFFLDTITNGTSIIKELYDNNCPYIVMREYGLEDVFSDLVFDTMNYINDKCIDDNYVSKYKKLGNSTNFFFKKTIYKVK